MNSASADMSTPSPVSPVAPRLLYCHCRYAQVVPGAVKNEVLRRLCDSKVPFEAVPDLCELSARKDPALETLAAGGRIKIAACYPRAVKWLFAAAGHPLEVEQAEVLNMRTQRADEIADALLAAGFRPNLPLDRTPASASASDSAGSAA
ncbi:MAG: hypothetical protein JNK85_30115 [Verrucomicrobiales bacterium]|nr:hypothetical protein [Verrucomicrobiales bacterium]